jgi:hypothetical protein
LFLNETFIFLLYELIIIKSSCVLNKKQHHQKSYTQKVDKKLQKSEFYIVLSMRFYYFIVSR